tara:strand:+ start:239 stop:847 length:609 start_codon:yes stop_codon:yes gene_type:complete
MKTVEETEVRQAENPDIQKIIDQYLTEEDKDLICSKRSISSVRAFPGSELFHLYAEANSVKEFCDNGHLVNVKGFGIDYLINRDFSNQWIDFETSVFTKSMTTEIIMDHIDDGYIFDDDQLDKIYAWTAMSPYVAMSITEPIRNQLCRTVELLWDLCVMKSKAFSTQSNETAQTMMRDIINHWSETVIIPHRGIGRRNLLDE